MQVARGDILTYFNQIFVGLCKLFADVDVDVKNGSNLLDRLIKVCSSMVWLGVAWRVMCAACPSFRETEVDGKPKSASG